MHVPTLVTMLALHFLSMFILMYSMVDVFGHVYENINNLYMAGIMTAPMLIIEILLMGSMYAQKSALQFLLISGTAALIFSILQSAARHSSETSSFSNL